MDKNTILGFILIFGILLVWNLTSAPDRKELEKREQTRLDSLRQLEQRKADSLAQLQKQPVSPLDTSAVRDTQVQQQIQQKLSSEFGAFAPAAVGTESFEVLENEVMRIIFASKGGRIKEVELKEYFKVQFDSNHKEVKQPLKMLEDEKNQFEYKLPVAGLANPVSTSQLYFQPVKEGNSLIFKASAGEGRFFEQVYTLQPGSYALQYQLRFTGLSNVLNQERTGVELKWVNFLDKLEQNHNYERNYSTVYYKPTDDSYDYCNCTSNDTDELTGKPIKWVAHSNQFFASVLYAKEAPFRGAVMGTEVLVETDADLKKLTSDIVLPLGGQEQFDMEFYIGPKKFENLAAYKSDLEDIVPFGSSIIGSANRWIVRPLFNFLSTFIGIKGIVILVLTLIVKLLLYPLSYKMLYSQMKMASLKPQLTGLREKYKEDQQTLQMETMKIYREFGVNPLGGCLPVLLQMPVWLALYKFFPASIEFRQANFLWATDLSSYDAAFWLPFNIPFYGQHVSLFTLLWVVTTLWYTYYNMKTMDMSAMGQNAQMMKWMQYLMPVFFLFFFNNFASGLTVYLVFSNLLNVFQTVATKKWVISETKIKAELEAYRAKPKKKGGFQSRLEEAMKQQQSVAAQREAAAKSKQQPKKK